MNCSQKLIARAHTPAHITHKRLNVIPRYTKSYFFLVLCLKVKISWNYLCSNEHPDAFHTVESNVYVNMCRLYNQSWVVTDYM